MRTEDEVSEFTRDAERAAHDCKACKGADPSCKCAIRAAISSSAYEACIPQAFWDIDPADVKHNVDVFKNIVAKYIAGLKKALRAGYGLLFFGDNGVGKTMFISYILMKAISKGRTTYYTTVPQLDHDIRNGFGDPRSQRRLRHMMTSDFVAIDEMGKEKHKNSSDFMKTQIERILKQRLDDNLPCLIATNLDFPQLSDHYGETVVSILQGKCQPVAMKPGDFRKKLSKKMVKDMGY